jgi:hypothetical protein
MTPRTEDRKHTGSGQCVAGGSFAARFPKWQPVYVAYAFAQGATDVLAFRQAETSSVGFNVWRAKARETFRLEHRIPSFDLTRHQEREFDRWIEQHWKRFALYGAEAAD